MNKEQIYQQLQLEPEHDFFCMRWRTNLRDPRHRYYAVTTNADSCSITFCYRETGRTTSILVDAMVCLILGKKVMLFGHSYDYANLLKKQMLRMLNKMGLNLNPDMRDHLIKSTGIDNIFLVSDGEIIFYDHYALECRETSIRQRFGLK